MKFHLGHYEITGAVKIPEFMLRTRLFFIDIDFTPWKQARKMSRWLPVGWCGAAGFPGGEPPWKYHLHSSWHAWHGEPDRVDIKLGDRSWHYEFGERT